MSPLPIRRSTYAAFVVAFAAVCIAGATLTKPALAAWDNFAWALQ